MIKGNANPLNLEDKQYFFLYASSAGIEKLESQRFKKKPTSVLTEFDKKLAAKQNNICPVCGDNLWNGEKLHKHHIIP